RAGFFRAFPYLADDLVLSSVSQSIRWLCVKPIPILFYKTATVSICTPVGIDLIMQRRALTGKGGRRGDI
ncbi:hypothetical protein, partial [Paraburkholderia caledonica]|uniref:hypothetical protein n=1 Tax=Paraburkholderia caledonica TaxID=134536 RepID=UPI001C500821